MPEAPRGGDRAYLYEGAPRLAGSLAVLDKKRPTSVRKESRKG